MIAALWACTTVPPPEPPRIEGLVVTSDGGDSLSLASATVDDPPATGRGVGAVGQVAGEPPVQITGDRSAWSLPDGAVTFEGSVRVERGGLVITSERVAVTMSGDDVVRAEATGAVRAEDGGRVATGGRAVLDVRGRTVVLTETPKLVDGGRTLVGERITFHLDAQRVDCDRCTLSIAP